MGRPVSFDFTTGGGSPEEFLMGVVYLEPTLMHTIGSTVVLPDAPYPVKLVNGKAVHPNVAVSPAGPEPAWAYKVTIENELTGKAWSEFRGVPTGTTQIAYKDLTKFVTTIPPQTTAGMMQNWADTTEANAERSELAADRAEAPTDLMNKNLIENPASLTAGALSAAIDGSITPNYASFTTAGDSITEGNQDGTGTTYPALLDAALPGVAVTNLGKSGWTSTEVAHRFGYPFILGAFTAPAGAGQANSVQVPLTFPAGSYRESVGIFPSWLGELRSGSTVIPGRLRHTIDPGAAVVNAWTFERTTAGAATAIPAGAEFVSTEFDGRLSDVFLIGVGRNNIADPDIVVRDINAIIERLPAKAAYLVLSVTTAIAETTGTPNHIRILALNARLASEYGPRYVDTRRYLIDRGLIVTGLTPTPADITAQEGDTIPPSLLVADGLHPNQYGYKAMAQAIINVLPSRGWLRSTPLAIPGVNNDAVDPTAPAFRWLASDLSGTDGTAVASWPAKTGAVALTGAGSAQPTIVTTTGKKYVRFDGVDDMLTATGIGITQPTTILVKAKVRTLGTAAHGLVWSQASPGLVMTATASGAVRIGGNTNVDSPASQFVEGVDSVFTGVYDGASSRARVDGNTPTTGGTGTAGLSTMRVGYAFDSTGRYASIDVAEIRIYKRALTDAEVTTRMAEMNA